METTDDRVLPTKPKESQETKEPEPESEPEPEPKEPESEEKEESPKDESFFDRYKYHLLVIGVLILVYLGYIYYNYTNNQLTSCFGSIPESIKSGSAPLEPFFSPEEVIKTTTQSVAEVVKSGVQKAAV